MGIQGFEVGADLDALRDLNERQLSYVGRFTAIMMEVQQQSKSLTTKWEGSEEYAAKTEEFDTRFDQVVSAFKRMVDASDGAVDNYNDLKSYWNSIFS